MALPFGAVVSSYPVVVWRWVLRWEAVVSSYPHPEFKKASKEKAPFVCQIIQSKEEEGEGRKRNYTPKRERGEGSLRKKPPIQKGGVNSKLVSQKRETKPPFPLFRGILGCHVSRPMLRFKKIKTEHFGRARKTLFVPPRNARGGQRIPRGKKTPLPEKGRGGKGREGEGRGVTFLTQIRSIARN